MAKDISKVYLSSDHAGIDLRKAVAAHLQAAGYAVEDLGPEDGMSVDYPDYGAKLAMAMNEDRQAHRYLDGCQQISVDACGACRRRNRGAALPRT